ncbi:MAG: hypothetical protein DMG39_13290 [Acidobacteria bacterium]|nr:MAG: hypothetical protein DMG39_13290 [Acidobacteriota bacterium]
MRFRHTDSNWNRSANHKYDKTSITLSRDLLTTVDRLAGSKQSRSAFIERVLRRYLKDRRRASIHARDLKLLNQAPARLNGKPKKCWNTRRRASDSACIPDCSRKRGCWAEARRYTRTSGIEACLRR